MTKKPNFAKFMLGLVVLASLFIGTWATTRGPLTSAKTSAKKSATTATVVSNHPNLAAPLTPTAPLDNVLNSFELEGDILDSPAGPPDDWSSVNCGGGTADVKSGVIFDGVGTTIFTGGGSKDHENLDQWQHTGGSVPPKDEILNAYAAKYTGAVDSNNILTFGADRYANNGTAFIGFWFFVNPVFPAADGKFRTGPLASDPLAAHALGDILVLVEFTNGGSFATAKVFEWVGTSGSESNGTLNDITGTAPAGSVFSISNGSPVTIPGTCSAWQHNPKQGPNGTIQTNAFFEGAINLSAFPALSNACFSSFLAETRSSSVVTATLKDFVLGQFDTCPEISVTKVARDDEVCVGDPVTYDYTVNNPTTFNLNVTLVDDNETGGTGDDLDVGADGNCAAIVGSPTSFVLNAGASRTFTCTRSLSVGSHTNIVTAVASFGGFSDEATATETVTVSPSPDLLISSFSCDLDGSSTLTVTDSNATGATYSWTRNGAAFAGNVASVTVTQAGTYVVTATTAAGCVDTATRVVGLCSD